MADRTPDKGMLFLFPNQYKTEDKHPYLTGTGDLHVSVLEQLKKQTPDHEGMIKLQCAAWSRVSKNGKKYVFVTFDKKEERGNAEIPDPSGETSAPTPDEDIPF